VNLWESKYLPTPQPLSPFVVDEPEAVRGEINIQERDTHEVISQFPKEMAKLKEVATRLHKVWGGLIIAGATNAVIVAANALISSFPPVKQITLFTWIALTISFLFGGKSNRLNISRQESLILEYQRALATIEPKRPFGS